jgi:hypothetical protein
MAAMNDTAVVMGQSFDTAKNDALSTWLTDQ